MVFSYAPSLVAWVVLLAKDDFWHTRHIIKTRKT
jgi:hypothetical protein